MIRKPTYTEIEGELKILACKATLVLRHVEKINLNELKDEIDSRYQVNQEKINKAFKGENNEQ